VVDYPANKENQKPYEHGKVVEMLVNTIVPKLLTKLIENQNIEF
jgi:hypothetical protein